MTGDQEKQEPAIVYTSEAMAILAGEIADLRDNERNLKTKIAKAQGKAELADEIAAAFREVAEAGNWNMIADWLARYDALE